MAGRRAFRPGAAAISRKRETTWFQFQPVRVTIGPGTAVLVFALNAAALALRPFTIVRTRFLLGLRSDQAAVNELQEVGVGLAVVSDQAVGVGVTAIPTPITDMGSNLWFVHQLMYADESALVDKVKPMITVEVDSKAMRKVEVGQDIVVVAETTGASDGAIVVVGGRLLIKNN